MKYLGHTYTQNYSLFIRLNFAGHPVFLFAKSGNLGALFEIKHAQFFHNCLR